MLDTRLVAIPDTDGQLLHLLSRLGEVLVALAMVEPDDLPPAVGLGPDAVEAVRRAWSAVDQAERAPTPRLVAADGRFELIPLRFVELREVDLARIAQAVTILRLALQPAGDVVVSEALDRVMSNSPDGPGTLVADFARSHALLDLGGDDDTRLLVERLTGATGRVVFTPAEEASYRRVADRVLEAFRIQEPLARLLGRGT
jgi:hypothetical protein